MVCGVLRKFSEAEFEETVLTRGLVVLFSGKGTYSLFGSSRNKMSTFTTVSIFWRFDSSGCRLKPRFSQNLRWLGCLRAISTPPEKTCQLVGKNLQQTYWLAFLCMIASLWRSSLKAHLGCSLIHWHTPLHCVRGFGGHGSLFNNLFKHIQTNRSFLSESTVFQRGFFFGTQSDFVSQGLTGIRTWGGCERAEGDLVCSAIRWVPSEQAAFESS